jgi:hypothetical protein
MEEGLSATINIEVSEEDGRYDYTISCDRELPLDEVRGILAGALSLKRRIEFSSTGVCFNG